MSKMSERADKLVGILLQSYLDGTDCLSVAELAKALGCSPTTARETAFRENRVDSTSKVIPVHERSYGSVMSHREVMAFTVSKRHLADTIVVLQEELKAR